MYIEYPFQVWNVINIHICWNMIKLAVCDNIGVVRAEGTVPAIELIFVWYLLYGDIFDRMYFMPFLNHVFQYCVFSPELFITNNVYLAM